MNVGDPARRRSTACSRRSRGHARATAPTDLRDGGRDLRRPAPPSSGSATGSASSTRSAEVGPLAASVDDTDGVVFVPAFTGLGQPVVGPVRARRGVGITRGTDARASGPRGRRGDGVPDARRRRRHHRRRRHPVTELRVDGGATAMDVLLPAPGRPAGGPRPPPVDQETTALGAAYLAGMAEGVWASPADAAAAWREEAAFVPAPLRRRRPRRADWRRGVERAEPGSTPTSAKLDRFDIGVPPRGY